MSGAWNIQRYYSVLKYTTVNLVWLKESMLAPFLQLETHNKELVAERDKFCKELDKSQKELDKAKKDTEKAKAEAEKHKKEAEKLRKDAKKKGLDKLAVSPEPRIVLEVSADSLFS